MHRHYKIKWREVDEQELRRVVRNFNAKIRRLEKKNPKDAKYLPKFYDRETDSFTDRLSVKQMKELIQTRADFKREINALKRFSRRGSEKIITLPDTDYNIKTTAWQKRESQIRLKYINKRREERLDFIENLEMTSRGESLGYTRADIGMGSTERAHLQPLKSYTSSTRQDELKWKWATIMRESQLDYFTERDFRARDNYIKALENNFGPQSVKHIVERIKEMSIEKFLETFESEGGSFDDAYPMNEEQKESALTKLESTYLPKDKPKEG